MNENEFTVATLVDGKKFVGHGDHLRVAVADMIGKIVAAGYSTTLVLSIEVSHPNRQRDLERLAEKK